MILTLTLNPAIDRNLTVDKLVFEDRAYILSTRESAGGRGINASCVIDSFGGKTLAIVASGGRTGKRLEEYLLSYSFPVEIVKVRSEVRTNVTVADRQGLAVKLNERGASISRAELARVERAVTARLPEAAWLMLCGSAPPGTPSDFYARLIDAARQRGVRTLVDTDGDPLLPAIEARPTVVTPNQPEAERLLNRALITRNHFIEAAERIQAMGAEYVGLSLGSRGAVGAGVNEEIFEVIPPRVDALCPIGAGDALAAAFAWASSQAKTFQDALRWGVAAGTASARLPGVTFATLEQTREIYEKTQIRRV